MPNSLKENNDNNKIIDLNEDMENIENIENIEDFEDMDDNKSGSRLFDIKEEKETALLVGVDTGEYDMDISFSELSELADSAGVEVFGTICQKRSRVERKSYIGKGKLEEIKELCEINDVNLLIFNNELLASQIKNIEDATDIRTIDRTMLILDIFSSRATTSEGRIQVELAQQRYMLPRLIGMGKTLSRQAGGGSGGAGARRGGGEQKLETDRRHIRAMIKSLENQLETIEKARKSQRQRREKNEVPVIAIVGYTNVGKSTLLNTISGADVYAEDKLFATLDTTTRKVTLPQGTKVLFSDTVGFVRRLPHHLVEAFKSTLEEAVYADIILIVCDASSDEAFEQIEITKTLLNDLGATNGEIITVFNKIDAIEIEPYIKESNVYISASENKGVTELLSMIEDKLVGESKRQTLLFPYSDSSLLSEIRGEGKLFSEDFTEEGIVVDIIVNKKRQTSVEKYIYNKTK